MGTAEGVAQNAHMICASITSKLQSLLLPSPIPAPLAEQMPSPGINPLTGWALHWQGNGLVAISEARKLQQQYLFPSSLPRRDVWISCFHLWNKQGRGQSSTNLNLIFQSELLKSYLSGKPSIEVRQRKKYEEGNHDMLSEFWKTI